MSLHKDVGDHLGSLLPYSIYALLAPPGDRQLELFESYGVTHFILKNKQFIKSKIAPKTTGMLY